MMVSKQGEKGKEVFVPLTEMEELCDLYSKKESKTVELNNIKLDLSIETLNRITGLRSDIVLIEEKIKSIKSNTRKTRVYADEYVIPKSIK